jgi:3-hydroxyisobutyrate dehydrogenase-like beta-hydroxyacid dehydrogenase
MTHTHPQTGLIGVGLLGTALAETFLKAGHSVLGYDLNEHSLENLRKQGGTAALSATDVFQRCSTVVLSLPDSQRVHALVASQESFLNGQLLIDTTTGSPDDAARLGKMLADRDVEYLDATVLGSSEQTRRRDVVVMVGGRPDAFLRAQPVLECFASRHFYVGPWGAGSTAKLIVNLVLGLNRAVLAEGLSLAKQSGMDLPLMLEILRSGAAWSRVMDTKGQKMIDSDFQPPQARLDQHWKDVRLILDLGRTVGSPLPLSELHEQLLSRASELGYGTSDNSAIIRAFEPQGRSASDPSTQAEG